MKSPPAHRPTLPATSAMSRFPVGTFTSAGPRHSSSASVSNRCARSVSPACSACLPCSVRASNGSRSDWSSGTSSR